MFKYGSYVPQSEIIIDGKCAGYYVNLKKLSVIILKNASIVESTLLEQKRKASFLSIDNFEFYNNELTCSKNRFDRLIGNLRIVDDFSITKEANHKYFIAYAY